MKKLALSSQNCYVLSIGVKDQELAFSPFSQLLVAGRLQQQRGATLSKEGFGMDDELKKILNVLVYIIVIMLAVFVIFAIISFTIGCQDEDCPDVDTKCNGHRLMMCSSGGWEELDNCATLYYLDGGTSDGVCCETSDGAECREICE